MPSIATLVQQALVEEPARRRRLSALLAGFSEAHWGAIRSPGTLRASPAGALARDVELPPGFAEWAAAHPDELAGPLSPDDQTVHLPCCIETDTFVLALEDATAAPLPPGPACYPARHRLSRAIEAVRAIADGRLYGIGVVASEAFDEPRRAAILEGLPHLEREEAEDLYATYWGWCTLAQLRRTLDGD